MLEKIFVGHVGDTSEIIFFLLGAMTIVEVVDANGGFKFVREKVATKSQKALLWRISFMTFFLSAVLDNLTTSIVMIMVLRKLIAHRRARMRYAGMVIIAANAGGAFSPIGDVTTIMLWIKGCVTTMGVIKELFLPSLIAVLVPLLIMSYNLKGELVQVTGADEMLISGADHYTGDYELSLLTLRDDPVSMTEKFITPSMAALKPLITSEELYNELLSDWIAGDNEVVRFANDAMIILALTLRGYGCGVIPYIPEQRYRDREFRAMPFYPPLRSRFTINVSKERDALARSEPFLKMLRENSGSYHIMFR